MDRRAKPKRGKAEAKRPPARKSPTDNSARVRDLEKRLAEALEQQTAASEILRVISSSPSETQPVFDAIAHSAVRLCDAAFCGVVRFDGEHNHLVAHVGLSGDELAAARAIFPMPATLVWTG